MAELIKHGSQLRIGGTYRFVDPAYRRDYGDWTITKVVGHLFYASVSPDARLANSGHNHWGMVYDNQNLGSSLYIEEVTVEPDEVESYFV